MDDFFNDTGNPLRSKAFSNSEIGMLSLIGIISTLLISSTSYDIFAKSSPEKTHQSKKHLLMKSFSLYTNGKNILNTCIGPDVMRCIHGLRFLSMFWIIFGHTCYLKYFSPVLNQEAFQNFDQNASKMLIMNATVTTDTFFFLSGTLLCYIFMREWEKMPSFNVISFYILRYIRLTPPYAFMIFFYATLMYRLGSGPLWDSQIGHNRNICIENWWTNLLYVNNYINVDRMCMNQTWYLAVDMQLFWFSPFVLYPLAKWPRLGKGILGLSIFAAVLIPFLITTIQQLSPVMLYTRDDDTMGSVYVQIYIRTYARAGPYLIGIALGYLLHCFKGRDLDISRIYLYMGWILSVTSCIAVIQGAAVFYKNKHGYNPYESGIYAGLHRSVWALGLAWLTFACVKGYGGPVNIFLSWKFFIPLSRLTYCAYLCHYIVLLYNIGTMRVPFYLSEYNVIHEFAGNLLFSFVFAAVISLSFEYPFMNIGYILLREPRRLSKTESTETNSTQIIGARVKISV